MCVVNNTKQMSNGGMVSDVQRLSEISSQLSSLVGENGNSGNLVTAGFPQVDLQIARPTPFPISNPMLRQGLGMLFGGNSRAQLMKDGGPPRRAEIAGQDHMLAYITPEEAKMLKAAGGAGKPGPMGIMSFYDEGDDYTGPGGDQAAQADGTQGAADWGPGGGGYAGSGGLTDNEQTLQDMGYDMSGYAKHREQQAKDLAMSFMGGPNATHTPGAYKNTNWFDKPNSKFSKAKQAVIDDIRSQIADRKAKAKGLSSFKVGSLEIPSIFGMAASAISQFTLDKIQKEIDEGGQPVMDADGNIAGVFHDGVFGTVYTGGPVEGMPETGWIDPDEMGGDEEQKKTPLDPCPEGYVYSEETESCVKVESEEAQKIGTKFERNPTPDLTGYGQKGYGGEYNFFKQMPGIIQAKDGIPRGPNGEIRGAGGPKDDLVGPFMLSNQEYVEPYERVLDEGNGNYDRGIRVLEKKRMAALRKYRDRVKSEERNKA